MLTEERIRKLSAQATPLGHDIRVAEEAIRLAVAETAEACAQRADAVSALYKEGVRGSYQITSVSKACAAAEVAADIRAAAKGAK